MKNYILSTIIIALFFSCANPKPLTGGDKDQTPPQVKSISPKNYSAALNPSTITIEFDEKIAENNIKENLFITPYIDNPYESKIKKNSLTLTFEKPFKENTTYTIYFNNSLKDITENNETKDVKYVFATGPFIDSLKLTAQVKSPEDQTKCEQCLVTLYEQADTTSIENSKPMYFGYTTINGDVTLENIKEGTYKLFSLQDENKNFIYDKGEKIAFHSSPVVMDTNQQSINLELIQTKEKEKQEISRINNHGNVYQIKLKNSIKSFELCDSIYKNINVKYWYSDRNTLNIQYADSLIMGWLISKDSINQIDTTEITLSQKTKKRYIGLKSISENPKPEENISIALSNRPTFIADSLIYFVSDSTTIKNIGWKLDSNRNILNIIPAKDLITYKLKIDSSGIQNELIASKDFEISIKTKQETETGIIKGTSKCKSNVILELLDDQYNVVSKKRNPSSFTFDYLEPTSYKLRLILDENNNGVWDSGSFKDRVQPEKIIFHNSTIKLRKNWEIKDIQLKCP